jgi:hypothetical protein
MAGGLGFWGVLRSWRWNVQTQLRLNRCVGETAQSLREYLDRIETANKTIRSLRAAVTGFRLATRFELIPPLLEGIQVAVLVQDSTLALWQARRVTWLTRRGCGKWGDWALPLPDLKLRRGVPDADGQQVLEWIGARPNDFRIQVHHRSRAAAARVDVQSESNFGSASWQANWAVPQKTVLQ